MHNLYKFSAYPSGMLSSLSLILLVYNEERNLPQAIKSAQNVAGKVAKRYEILPVLYEGSTDRSEEILKAAARKDNHIQIIYQRRQEKGYGVALRLGIEAARYDYVFYTDADNQFDLRELARLTPYADTSDIVSGYRKKRRDPFGRILSAKVYNILLRILFGLPVRDVDSAFKLYNRRVFRAVKMRAVTGLIDAEILIKARNKGFTITEVPVHHFPRPYGSSNYGRGIVQPRVVLNIFKEIWVLRKELTK